MDCFILIHENVLEANLGFSGLQGSGLNHCPEGLELSLVMKILLRKIRRGDGKMMLLIEFKTIIKGTMTGLDLSKLDISFLPYTNL